MDKGIIAFLAVARTGSITAAADRIHLAQSSVTKRISALETELDTQLFHRDRRGMSLNEAGERFYLRAERIEREYHDGLEEIAAISSAGLSELRIGAGPVFHFNWVSGLFAELLKQFPNLKLDLKTEYRGTMGNMLHAGEVDIYLGILMDDAVSPAIHSKMVTKIEHGIVLRQDDPISQAEAVDPKDLSGYRWVSFTNDAQTEKRIEEHTLPRGQQTSHVDIRTTSLVTGAQLVQTGRFVMSAPLQLADFFEKDGLVIRPVLQRMHVREAGIHVRKSSLEYGAIKASLAYFDTILDK